jgi:hypothetical protein
MLPICKNSLQQEAFAHEKKLTSKEEHGMKAN